MFSLAASWLLIICQMIIASLLSTHFGAVVNECLHGQRSAFRCVCVMHAHVPHQKCAVLSRITQRHYKVHLDFSIFFFSFLYLPWEISPPAGRDFCKRNLRVNAWMAKDLRSTDRTHAEYERTLCFVINCRLYATARELWRAPAHQWSLSDRGAVDGIHGYGIHLSN